MSKKKNQIKNSQTINFTSHDCWFSIKKFTSWIETKGHPLWFNDGESKNIGFRYIWFALDEVLLPAIQFWAKVTDRMDHL